MERRRSDKDKDKDKERRGQMMKRNAALRNS
jgi:hypothetical protein